MRHWIAARSRHSVNTVLVFLTVLFLVALPSRAMAQTSTGPDSTPAPEASAPKIPWQQGPKQIALGHDLTLVLTDRYAFLEREPAAKLLEKSGGLYNENLLGLVVGTQPEDDWFVVIRFDSEGYIKDDESIDSDEILKAIKEGQEEANKEREKRGFIPLSIDGWQEPPHYEKAVHHLVWGLKVGSKEGQSINYNTRILGRKGYVSLNLVTDAAKLTAQKPHAAALLSQTTFGTGSRYEDFDKKTDKVAEYGLGGLVLAGAGLTALKLVKLGLLAKFGKVIIVALLAAKKFLIIGAVALIAMFKNLFKRKQQAPTAPPGYGSQTQPPPELPPSSDESAE